jgi:hypothetical protein
MQEMRRTEGKGYETGNKSGFSNPRLSDPIYWQAVDEKSQASIESVERGSVPEQEAN